MQIFKWLSKQSCREKELIAQRRTLRTQQNTISMVDEFAKFSKLQRRINIIEQELEEIRDRKPSNSFVIQLSFTYGVKVALGILLVLLSIYYRYTPVFYLGDKVNLIPFSSLMCYPNQENFVSFYSWAMCCAAVARSLNQLIK